MIKNRAVTKTEINSLSSCSILLRMKKSGLLLLLICNYSVSFTQIIEILVHPEKVICSEIKVLNSDERECNLSIMPDGKTLYFMSTRSQKNGTVGGNGDIYQSKFVHNSWQAPTALGENINTFSGEDEPSVDADGENVFYQSWNGDWRAKSGPYFKSQLKSGDWGKGIGLGGGITQFFAKESSANMGYGTDGMAVSSDGNLFIVACGPDYNSAMDIYYSTKKNGVWSFPKIMGISTDGDERSVFIAGDNKTIYFSSDGHGGFGGLDIFKVVIGENGKLGDIINIGEPFNTAADDQGFVASVDGKSAFFIRNLDIYYADISNLTEKIKPKNETVETPKPTLLPTEEPEIRKQTTFDSMVITVYFNFNESLLSPSEKLKLITQLNALNNLGDYAISLAGHCDNVGPNVYNDKLSTLRINTVYSLLGNTGVKAPNIKQMAFGENMPKENNATEAGRKLNRRVDITLKKKN